jgi:hypothetical protein
MYNLHTRYQAQGLLEHKSFSHFCTFQPNVLTDILFQTSCLGICVYQTALEGRNGILRLSRAKDNKDNVSFQDKV